MAGNLYNNGQFVEHALLRLVLYYYLRMRIAWWAELQRAYIVQGLLAQHFFQCDFFNAITMFSYNNAGVRNTDSYWL